MQTPHRFDPRFSDDEKLAMSVVTYDDLIAVHEEFLRKALDNEEAE